MGSVGIRIFACSKSDVERILPKPNWEIFSSGEGNLHKSFIESIPESDIDEKSPLLQKFLYIQKQEAAGKQTYPVRGKYNGEWEYREIWARSIDEIKERFPSLEFQYHVPFPDAEYSDIDVKDEFISRYEVNDT